MKTSSKHLFEAAPDSDFVIVAEDTEGIIGHRGRSKDINSNHATWLRAKKVFFLSRFDLVPVENSHTAGDNRFECYRRHTMEFETNVETDTFIRKWKRLQHEVLDIQDSDGRVI